MIYTHTYIYEILCDHINSKTPNETKTFNMFIYSGLLSLLS